MPVVSALKAQELSGAGVDTAVHPYKGRWSNSAGGRGGPPHLQAVAAGNVVDVGDAPHGRDDPV